MPPPRSRFSYLPRLDLDLSASVLGPTLVVALLAAWGIRYLSALVKAIRGPSWHAGDSDLSKAGTPVNPTTASTGSADEKTFDVIIVGGGACGCVLASRLSEDPAISVLLLEAGHAGTRQLFSRIPSGFARLFETSADWGFWTEGGANAAGVKGRRLRWPRGRMLGGSTSSNAMICHHCAPSDFDEIEALGNKGWNYASLLPYFAKSQTLVPSSAWPVKPHPDAKQTRGTNGPLNAGYSYLSGMSAAFITTCGSLGIKIRDDINTDGDGSAEPAGSGTLGVTRSQTLVHNGERVSTSTGYLTKEVLARSNLRVATGATVTRIVFDGSQSKPRASGVEFTHAAAAFDEHRTTGPTYRARARKEVVLAAGSLASPQILEVSGVGSRAVLEKAGVQVLVELPGVGENLKDHTAVGICYVAKPGVSLQYMADPVRGVPPLVEWLKHKTGPMTSNLAETIAFVRSTDGELAKTSGVAKSNAPDFGSGGVGPDIEFVQAALAFADNGKTKPIGASDFYTIGSILARPQSKGSVHITTASMMDRPTIRPNILSDKNDVASLVWSVKFALKIANTEPLASLLVEPYNGPGFPPFPDATTDEGLAEWCRLHTETLYHPVGTVKMGSLDAGGCLDAQLRVHGVDSLRVCDASIFPEQLSGHPMMPLVAIAERFADQLKDEL